MRTVCGVSVVLYIGRVWRGSTSVKTREPKLSTRARFLPHFSATGHFHVGSPLPRAHDTATLILPYEDTHSWPDSFFALREHGTRPAGAGPRARRQRDRAHGRLRQARRRQTGAVRVHHALDAAVVRESSLR